MVAKLESLRAEERSTYIARAITDWRALAGRQAVTLAWNGGTVLWNEARGYWSFFGKANTRTRLGWRWWNTFGRVPQAFRQNMLVEINPPQKGPAKGTQGIIALDANDRRWLLHGGRLHPPGTRVSHDEFQTMSRLTPTSVAFSDGRVLPYFAVAPLDEGAEALDRGVEAFVAVCEDIRIEVLHGPSEAALDRRIRHQEGESTPEKRGPYVIPPRPATAAKRIHADVWKALTADLDRRRIAHSNRRVGRYGPDLRTREAPRLLFEIKTDTTARSLYEALGQLLMYERLLGDAYARIAVLPGIPPSDLARVLKDMKVSVLTYRASGRSYAFDPRTLNALLGGG